MTPETLAQVRDWYDRDPEFEPHEHLEALMADAGRWPIWRKLLLDTCDHRNVVGVSAQLLAVARA